MESAHRKLNELENFVNSLGIDYPPQVKRGTRETSVLFPICNTDVELHHTLELL